MNFRESSVKWIEQIRVRTSEAALRNELPKLDATATELSTHTPRLDALVLTHAIYDGDCTFILVWENDNEPTRTREGHIVAEQLRRVGMVDHSVWRPHSA